ncbi:common central domain of tyrosinase-domain-containing protein [Melanogaster broomeanus]|nr:common central domain of tyrosinase-domain-containing protein [Melanogaster broomeanus]
MSDRGYYPVTGRKTTGAAFDRIPIDELQNDHPYQWALFVLGYAWIENKPIPFPGVVEQPPLESAISLMEIGGIHGKPYRQWAGDFRPPAEAQADYDANDKKDTNPVPRRFGGFCNHASVSFPTWHRPYVMVVEQAIGDYADNIAQQIANAYPVEGPTWINAAKELRFPYWDWADPKVDEEPFPSVFYADELTIRAPGPEGQMVDVPNPLAFYAFPYIPEDFTQNTRGDLTAYFNLWPQTFRRADSTEAGGSDIDRVITSIVEQRGNIRKQVGQLFMYPDGGDSSMIWDQFSNSLNESRQSDDDSGFGSLEVVHGAMHSFVGGNGHMGYPDYAGFDPFFYFHHANVDRILALWEWCYTDYWMNDGYTANGRLNSWTQQAGTYAQVYNERITDTGEFGMLAPFRREDGSYWTNNDTRFLTPDAYPKYYSYKEFLGVKVDIPAANLQEQQEARARIARYYEVDLQKSARETNRVDIPAPGVGEISLPLNFTSIRGFRLFVILARLPEHAFGHSYDLRIYYKETKPVGNVSVFARTDDSPCRACAFRRTNTAVVRGVIIMSPSIVNEIIVESGIDRSTNTMEITTELITRALTGKLLDVSGKLLASAKGGDSVAEHINDSKQPVYLFDWNSHKALFPSGWKAEDVEATQV